jgi:hypothetical protein
MSEFVSILPQEPLLQIVLVGLALIMGLAVLRFALRLTMKVFTCGLTLIVLVGAGLILMRVFGIA